MTLPKQITPCPINQAVVEIRFNTEMPSDAVFGVVFNKLKNSYQKAERLPILQIPEAVRNEDSNLTFQPHYKLIKDFYALQIGPKVLSLAITNRNYSTWNSYYSEIENVFEKINETDLIENVIRVGLRYMNFFAEDIWKRININVEINEKSIDDEEIFLRTVLEKDGVKVLLQAGNQLNLEENNEIIGRASVIDIDSFVLGENIDFFGNMKEILWKSHNIEKEIFFNLLKEDFLETLNPEY